MVLDSKQTSAPTQNDQAVNSGVTQAPSPNNLPTNPATATRNTINSLYGGYVEQESLQQATDLENISIVPEIVKNPETNIQIEPTIQQEPKKSPTTPEVQIGQNEKVPNVEDHSTHKVQQHSVNAKADAVTSFADKDEEEFITGIVQHHAN